MRLPEFDENHRVVTRGFLRRPEDGLRVAGVNENAKRAVNAVRVKPAAIGHAFMKRIARLSDPDDRLRTPFAGGAGERKRKTENARGVPIIARAQFVNGAARKRNRSAGEIVRTRKVREFPFLNVGDAPPEPRELGAAGDGVHPANSIFSYGRGLEQKENF